MAPTPARALTVDDLEALPDDDGNRYELLDGELLVNPEPSTLHQRMTKGLFLVLHAAVAAGLEVLFAPFDWRVGRDNQFEPDGAGDRPAQALRAHLVASCA